MTNPADVNSAVSEGEVAGLRNGQCEFCERRGLPILPVRYAVCERLDRYEEIPELPEDRIREFTDIMLDKALVDGDERDRTVPDDARSLINASTGTQVNKYILRQLRQGYLYLYDQDNPDGMHWYAYAITSDGKFYQFPVSAPRSLDDIEFPCQNKKNDALHASLVTIPDPDKSGTLYYAFTEHAWPPEHIQMIGKDAAWREKNMQKVDITGWVGGQQQPFAYSTDELEMVAEYSDGADDLDGQFWSSGPERELFTREDMKNAMDLRLDHAAGRYQGKGLILAVNDELGIIEELNAYRHQALAEIEDFFDAKGSDAEKRLSEERRRKLLCKQAIDAFQQNFARAYRAKPLEELDAEIEKAQKERDDFIRNNQAAMDEHPYPSAEGTPLWQQKARLDRNVARAREDREQFQTQRLAESDSLIEQRQSLEEEISELERLKAEDNERLQSNLEEARQSGDSNQARVIERLLEQDHFHDPEITQKKILLDNLKSEEDRVIENHQEQLNKLYDQENLDEFYRNYREKAEPCEALLPLHDSDYALWVKKHLPLLINRYSTTDYWMGLGLSGALGNVLRGGILSPATGSIWQSMAEDIDSPQSPVLVALFSNQKSLIAQAIEDAGSISPESQVSSAMLQSWGERFNTLQAAAKTLDDRTPREEEIINRFRKIRAILAATIGNSLASLVTYNLREASSEEMKQPLRHFVYYEQLAFMADPGAQKGDVTPPKVMNVTMTMAEFYEWLRLVSRLSDNKNRQGADTDRALKSIDENIGNFAAPMAERDVKIQVTLPYYRLPGATIERLMASSNLSPDYTPDKEKERHSDLSSSARDVANTIASEAGGYGQVLAACLVFWNLVLSVNKDILDRDEGDSADLSKILGAGVTLTSGAMKAVEGYHGIRTASLGVQPNATVNGAGWKMTGNVLGTAAGLLSIWDGLKKLGEASQASRTGQSLSAENNLIMGGVGVVGGIASIIVVGASAAIGLGVGLFFGILTLLLGYWFITLVAPSVEMWVNRSLVGSHEGQINRFEDMASEQSSLEMVFQGVVVELSWSHDNPGTNRGGALGMSANDMMRTVEATERGDQQVKINLIVKLPSINALEVDFRFFSSENVNTLFEWRYQKDGKGEDLYPVVSMGSESSSNQPVFTERGNIYIMEYKGVFSKSDLGGSPQLTLSFRSSSAGARVNDTFELVM